MLLASSDIVSIGVTRYTLASWVYHQPVVSKDSKNNSKRSSKKNLVYVHESTTNKQLRTNFKAIRKPSESLRGKERTGEARAGEERI